MLVVVVVVVSPARVAVGRQGAVASKDQVSAVNAGPGLGALLRRTHKITGADAIATLVLDGHGQAGSIPLGCGVDGTTAAVVVLDTRWATSIGPSGDPPSALQILHRLRLRTQSQSKHRDDNGKKSRF